MSVSQEMLQDEREDLRGAVIDELDGLTARIIAAQVCTLSLTLSSK